MTLSRVSPHAGMVARELRDRLVHALLKQVLVTEQTVQDVAFLAELQRFAVAAVMLLLQYAVGADVVQQASDHHQALVDEARRYGTAGHPVRRSRDGGFGHNHMRGVRSAVR